MKVGIRFPSKIHIYAPTVTLIGKGDIFGLFLAQYVIGFQPINFLLLLPSPIMSGKEKDNKSEFHDWALSLIIGMLKNCLSLFN